MRFRNYSIIPILAGLMLVGVTLLVMPAPVASAQCGSQVSSCKNCHEVQAADPVNKDGTGWHQSHAFGDFCYVCHAGNNQSPEKDVAHAGMLPPLADVQAACQACHPADLMEKAQVYAAALGVEVGAGGSSPATTEAAQTSPAPASNLPAEPAPPEMVVQPADVIDYSQIYDQTVLGNTTLNWGNVILGLFILVVVLAGVGFIYWNERRRQGLPLSLKSHKASAVAATPAAPVEYSPEVTALLPLLAKLDPVGLHALKRLLENQDNAGEMLHSLSHLDPELLRRIRLLDRDARALLMALSGN